MAIITVDDLKAHVGLAEADTTDDTTLTTAVAATNDAVALHCRRNFDLAAASSRVFRPLNGELAIVDDASSTDSLVVKTDEDDDGTFETTWSSSDYELYPLNGIVDGISGWPYTKIKAAADLRFPATLKRACVQVTAKWGWAAVPAPVKEAALIKAARLFRRKDSPEGVSGLDAFGPVRISKIEDPDVAMLLGPYVRLLV